MAKQDIEKSLKILLVEDSPSDASLLKESIAVSGEREISVIVAGSLRDAVERLRSENIDALLLDLTLPDSAGLETVLRVKLLHPDLPIVVLTGVDDEKIGIEAVRLGVQDYLVKGQTDAKAISRAIHYAIERKQAETAIRRASGRFELLSETAGQLLSSKDPLKLVNSLCRRVMDHLDCHVFFNFLADEKNKRLHLNAFAGVDKKQAEKMEWLDYGAAVCGCVARDGKRIIVENIPENPDPRAGLVRSLGVKAYACHPLLTREKLIGTLSFGSKTKTAFDDDDLAVMKNVADQVSIAMERIFAEEAIRSARDELEIRVEERTIQLKQQASLLDLAHEAIFVCDLENRIIFWNKGAVETYGWTEQEAIGNKAHVLLKTLFSKPFDEIKAEIVSMGQWQGELTQTRRDGSQIAVFSRWALQRDKDYEPAGILEINYDITERKNAEIRARIMNVLLELFAQKTTRKEYLDSVVEAIRYWSGCRCIGIRLTNAEGFIPYASCVGFSEQFLSLENMLSLKDDNCLCIRAITQLREGPDLPLVTAKGSFRSDNSLDFLSKLTEKQKSRYRGNCMKHGFASLAVIPIRYRQQILGAIHLADENPGKVPSENVDFLENMAMLIGEAVHRFDMEAKLRESEERYRRLVETSPDGIGVERDDVVVFINVAGAKLLGSDKSDEFIGRPVLDFVHPDFRERTRRLLEYLRKKGKSLPLREGKLLRLDCSGVDVEVAATPLVYQGKPSTQIVFRDIAERKRQEYALQLSRSRLAEAQRIAHLGNWEWDIESDKIWWSDETYRIFGVDPANFTPSYEAFLGYIHRLDREGVKQAIEDAIYKHKPYDLDLRIVRPDGGERVVRETGEVAYDKAGKPLKMFGTVLDVTEQKRIENEIRHSHHQLRLLTAQLSLVEEKERRRIASDLHDSVGQILAFASRELRTLKKLSPEHLVASMNELCSQLDQAIQQTRSLSFDLSPSILYDLGLEVAIEDLAERFCNERKIQCRFESIPGPKMLAEDVKILLYRAVRELLINVAKHAKAGSVRVSLAKAGDEIRITVEDNGQGFDVKQMETGLGKPRGFGIFSIRERLGHVGGRLEIESARGKGTKITLVAPLIAAQKS